MLLTSFLQVLCGSSALVCACSPSCMDCAHFFRSVCGRNGAATCLRRAVFGWPRGTEMHAYLTLHQIQTKTRFYREQKQALRIWRGTCFSFFFSLDGFQLCVWTMHHLPLCCLELISRRTHCPFVPLLVVAAHEALRHHLKPSTKKGKQVKTFFNNLDRSRLD